MGYNPVFLFSFFTVLFCFALLSIEGESHAWTSNSWTFLFFNIFWDITIIFMTYNIIFPRPIIGKLIIKSPYFFLYWSHKNSIQITWLSMSGKQDHENSITLQIFCRPKWVLKIPLHLLQSSSRPKEAGLIKETLN